MHVGTSTDLGYLFAQLAIAVGLGMLVGLQRERAAARLAGIRTFPLVTLSGALCALLAQVFGGWVLGAGFIALGGIILMGMRAELEDNPDPGLTTEIAILLMFALGAYLMVGNRTVAVALGGVVAVLLQFKGQMHGWAAKLGDEDIKAIMKFVLIALVILPILPDHAYGPYAGFNPRQTWWLVVLIVGISLAGYIFYKFLGEGVGTILAGILGGLISSTATTVSYSRRARKDPHTSAIAAIVILVASAVLFGRLLLIIAVVRSSFLAAAAPPIAVLLLVSGIAALIVWLRERGKRSEVILQENPAELKAALVFGLLFAAVQFIAGIVQRNFGDRGLYVVAGISGLTDVDAITLSTVQLVGNNQVGVDTAWRVIVLAAISNLVFKGAAVALLGSRRLLMQVLVLFGTVFAAGVLLLVFWPR
jgi:uncharacterized membrane protein (DUF4010 family)